MRTHRPLGASPDTWASVGDRVDLVWVGAFGMETRSR